MDNRIKDFWEVVIETMQEGLMIVSPEGIIISVNRAFEEMTGYTRDELIGKSCKTLNCDVCMNAQGGGKGYWCELFRIKGTRKKRCVLQRKDGIKISVLKNAALLYDSDKTILGAVETLTDLTEVLNKERQIEELKKALKKEDSFMGIVGNSAKMQTIFQLIKNAAKSDAPVIIYGESGTGKELVAEAIHRLSDRKDKPFIKVNCAAIAESLFESELFGHVKGAFTGAHKTRKGRFELANKGAIFLDEIGDLPEAMQVKLLRVLEEKVIERVGDSTPIPVDIRIISATNKDLLELVKQGKYRQDFFYRINVIPIYIPPLRERKEDLPLLVEHFLRSNRLKTGKEINGVSKEVMDIFYQYSWPGNVRELRSVIEYAFVVCDGPIIQKEHLIPYLLEQKTTTFSFSYNQPKSNEPKPIDRDKIIEALKKCNGNRTKASKLLGVSRVTLWKKIKKYGINL